MLRRKLLQFLLAVMLPALAWAQNTTSSMSGSVKTSSGEPLVGATVTAIHEPTGTKYRVQSRTGGRFDISNMNAGGPYTVEVSFVNFAVEKKGDVYLSLGETYKVDFVMFNQAKELGNVTVTGTRKTTEISGKGGTETLISREKMQNLPSVGRNLYDFLRNVPQAKVTSGEGITIAGQNNRYNSFYVDGAVNNDVFGLSANGTNGGQTGLSPLSIDAIDQFQVVISPYDASLGNFTGGGINAVTRSGTNRTEGSVYYFTRNQDLAGKNPLVAKELATKLPNFTNSLYGFRVGGALKKNKLFYFINAELERNTRPQPFEFSQYTGNTKDINTINSLVNTLKTTYGYDPGGFLNNEEKTNADRITVRLDWNINDRHKLSASNRYTKLERFNTSGSNAGTINFYNNGFYFPNRTNSTSLELKSLVGNKGASNRLLVTYTDVLDDRDPIGDPFPRVRINDGSGAFVFGPDNSSTINLLKQKNFSIFNIFKFNLGKHSMSTGVDYEYNDVFNAFVQNTFGNYTFANLNDFLTGARPQTYTLGVPYDRVFTDDTKAGAGFKIAKGSFFLNDEIRPSENLTLNFGIRADYYRLLSIPWTDDFTNTTALPVFASNYDLQGARSGMRPKFPIAISPRFGFTYKIPEENVVIRGGMGIFTGRIPLVWPGGIFNNNGIFQSGYTANSSQNVAAWNQIRFRANPYQQWLPSEVGISTSKGGLNLISEEFRMPQLFRTSLAIDKKFNNGWNMTLEGLYSQNINEIYYTNINLRQPQGVSTGAGARTVYPAPVTLPIVGTSNPYDNAILLTNNNGPKGFAYNLAATVSKRTRDGFFFEANYSFGNSVVVNEATSSVNLSQWRFMETVNGRNTIGRSNSDFSQGHRIFAIASKKFTYANKALATTITLTYQGQSGNPFSYVYAQNSMTRDDGPAGGNDLIYIPTAGDLQQLLAGGQILSTTVAGVTYTGAQQVAALNSYIAKDNYLNNNRGKFAERNASRLPFTNILNLKVAQDFNIKMGKQRYQFQLTYEVANFTNMLNRNWGRTYFMSNDQFGLIQFRGYQTGTLNPTYSFNPTIVNPWNNSTSVVPEFSNRWISQLGIRFNFN
jgi:hypothetical protein